MNGLTNAGPGATYITLACLLIGVTALAAMQGWDHYTRWRQDRASGRGPTRAQQAHAFAAASTPPARPTCTTCGVIPPAPCVTATGGRARAPHRGRPADMEVGARV